MNIFRLLLYCIFHIIDNNTDDQESEKRYATAFFRQQSLCCAEREHFYSKCVHVCLFSHNPCFFLLQRIFSFLSVASLNHKEKTSALLQKLLNQSPAPVFTQLPFSLVVCCHETPHPTSFKEVGCGVVIDFYSTVN